MNTIKEMKATKEMNATHPLCGVNFDPLTKIMIDSWAYLLKYNPKATYKIGKPEKFLDDNFMVRCEITILGETRHSYAAIKNSYPTAKDIEDSQHYALIKCVAMFLDHTKVVENNYENDIPF